ncbi:MAG TPA: ribbon-helix-helix domain-containing protein [Syntrophomonas sp.]|jgi:metal-responsive CopG/Arc/MetJ family transcriptional regulator|nr:ribbon-helix-helix domain-containing protein [Syntrophomonas sp.]
MPTEKPRYTVTVDEETLQKIDDFRFENRYPSRSAATLELIRLGMEQLKREQEEQKTEHKNKSTKEAETKTNK